ncbi:MAG: DUF1542 domain-containing protein, partial [Candidatus Limosilactobacillus intestinavium]
TNDFLNNPPVYISGSTFNILDGGSFELNAKNIDPDLWTLINLDGSINLSPHSSFKVVGNSDTNSSNNDQLFTAVNLSRGSVITADQPKEFIIDLSKDENTNKALIVGGKIQFTRVKNMDVDEGSQAPLGIANITYDDDGNVTDYKISALNTVTPVDVVDYLKNHKDKVSFVAAGEDVTVSDLKVVDNQLTGIVNAPVDDNAGLIYVVVTVNGTPVKLTDNSTYQVYTVTPSTLSNPTETDYNYTKCLGSAGGKFKIDLSSIADQLTDDAKVSIVATRDFVDSKIINTTIAELKKDDQTVDKTALQTAVHDSTSVKASNNYTNADTDKQKAYDNAIAAGQGVLDNANATQQQVNDAVTTINSAKAALNGDAKLEAVKDAAKQAVANAAKAKNEAIDASSLTTEEKAALKKQVIDTQTSAYKAIDEATTNQAVDVAKKNGIAAIESIKVVSTTVGESGNTVNGQSSAAEKSFEGHAVSDSSVNGSATPSSKNGDRLPQTGNETEDGLGIAGLAVTGLLGSFGLFGLRKKHD